MNKWLILESALPSSDVHFWVSPAANLAAALDKDPANHEWVTERLFPTGAAIRCGYQPERKRPDYAKMVRVFSGALDGGKWVTQRKLPVR